MRKGYILTFSIYILIVTSGLLAIKLSEVKTLYEVSNESQHIYTRLAAEKAVFDEILYNLYAYIDDDFEFNTENYFFTVSINDTDIKITVEGELEYVINLTYNDDCVCFIEILYN